ncbi:MAG: LysM peptidoglycan-binding domain-containing protein [Ardenticatenaceae bacterium]|nr:LysM peptidoglycan-binding domain-containing protein [Ardenticatenaceae bacterium]MCB9445716.1 LysM peptidoglycan-binding domain-containing protein [Ardenticatenaceae bacterium]
MRFLNWVYLIILLPVLLGCRSTESVVTGTPVSSATPTLPIGVSLVTRAVPTTAVIQTTPSPMPTATATPTATPIIYTIVEGDTLLGIAIQNQTTTEEIEAMNPDVQPALLQIGQTLVLPPPATPQFQGVASTAVPIQIIIRHVKAYQTPVGSLWLLGEVVNLGDLPAGNVQVSIGLLDVAGAELGTAVAWAAVPVIMPGQSAPFGILLNQPPANFVHPSVSVVGGETVLDLGTQVVDLLVGETAVTIADDRVQVDGTVQNSGQSTVQSVVVTATFYDDLGDVTGFQQQNLDGNLAPGETVSFNLTAASPGGPTANLTLTAYAQIVSE